MIEVLSALMVSASVLSGARMLVRELRKQRIGKVIG